MYNNIRNSVQLVGNIGADIQLMSFENGSKKVKLTLATNELFTNGKGEKVKSTEWHTLIAWGKTAEQMANTVQKGSEVSVQGRLANRSFVDKNGVTKYVTEVIVNDFFKIAKKQEQKPEPAPF